MAAVNQLIEKGKERSYGVSINLERKMKEPSEGLGDHDDTRDAKLWLLRPPHRVADLHEEHPSL